MQIHELDNFTGALNSGSYLPIDNGSDTGKITVPQILSDAINQIADTNARVDNIIAGGTAPSAAEVTDARKGANGLTYSSLGDAIRGQIDDITNEIRNPYHEFVAADFRQGAWSSATSIDNNTIRICSKRLYPVKAGDKLVYNSGSLMIGFGLWVNGTLTEYHDWQAVPSDTEYEFQHDGDFFIQFKYSNNATIVPTDYDGISDLYFGIDYRVDQIEDRVDYLQNQVGEYDIAAILANGTPPNSSNADCVQTSNYIPVKQGDVVELFTDRPNTSGYHYIYGVYGYNSANSMIVNLSPTDRKNLTSKYLVEDANVVKIKYAFTEYDGNSSRVLRTSSFSGYSVNVKISANSFAYGYNGGKLGINKGAYNVVKTSLFSPTISAMGSSAPQGFAIYNGKVIQFYSSSDKAAIFNFEDGTVLGSFNSNSGHGNAVDFFSEFADNSDPFPIALIADGLSDTAYEARIQLSGITIRKTIKFPVADAGYYVSTMVDALNNIVYTVGYKQNNYTDPTNNNMIIAKWDYSSLTDNGDSTYTPDLIDKFNIPFITTIQGPTFYNGKLFIMSSIASGSNANTTIYVVNPYEKRVCNVLTGFPNAIKNVETESMYFYEDNGIVYGFIKNYESNRPYYKMIFND